MSFFVLGGPLGERQALRGRGPVESGPALGRASFSHAAVSATLGRVHRVVERAQFGEEPARPPQDGHARRGERGRHRQVKRVGKVSGLASPTTHRAPRRHRSSGAARVHSHSVASRCGGTAAGKAAHPRHLRALLRAPPHAGTSIVALRLYSIVRLGTRHGHRPDTVVVQSVNRHMKGIYDGADTGVGTRKPRRSHAVRPYTVSEMSRHTRYTPGRRG